MVCVLLLRVPGEHDHNTHSLQCVQVAELCIYLALLADWSVLFDGSGAWKQIAALLATIALPVIYTRKIVDFGAKKS